jgi:hypothetical protein
MNTTNTTTTEYTAPLSTFISRITARLAPPAEKTVAPIPVPTPTMEVLEEVRAGHLTSAHIGKTISLGDGCRGKVTRIGRRFDAESGRTRTDVTTSQGGLRTYGADHVLLLVQLRPRPVPSVARTPAQLEYDAFRTAEYAAEKALATAATEALTPQHIPQLRTSGILAGMMI